MYNICVCVGFGLLGFSAGGVSMRGEQEKGGAGCDNSAGALTGHLREGPQGLAAGIAASTNKRVLRFFFLFLSSGGWGKKMLWLTTLPLFFIRVVCRFNSVAFAAQR